MSVQSVFKTKRMFFLSLSEKITLLFCLQMCLAQLSVAQPVGPPAPVNKPPQESFFTKALEKIKGTKATPESEKAEEKTTIDSETQNPTGITLPPATQMERPQLLTQPPLEHAKITPPEIDSENPPILDHPKLDDINNPLGFSSALLKLKKYSTLVDAKAYNTARPGLIQLRQDLVDLTEAHIELYKTLKKVSSASNQAQLEKELALQFAMLRDKAMVQTAKVYLAEKNYIKGVKELTDVVKSQPKSQLGLYAYELLQEAGFTEKLQIAQ